ncbi:ATP-binding protein [Limosilactobacillus gastricus]|uniref:ATP-binding protein n=1 Tax=Limosilactobacillus gastricus TaxID=227942 RepID=UPI00031E61ED|nr:ATP-binding protein [Limosilactobacillus gastricus]
MKNPFNPTFGDVPRLFLEKDGRESAEGLAYIIAQSDFSRSFFITGVRGSGKTVFMTRVSEVLAQNEDFVCIDLLNRENILANLVNQLYHEVKSKIAKALDSIESISISNFSITKHQDEMVVEVALDRLMTEIQKANKKVLITIDEVNDSPEIQNFAQIYSSLKRKKYPIFVLMTGLPDLVLDLQNNTKLTYLLRSEKIEMEPLDNLSVLKNYQQVFQADQVVLSKMAQMVKGYSYGFQLLGYLAYQYLENNGNGTLSFADLEEINRDYQLYLFENAYQKIFEGLSKVDIQYLIAVKDHTKLEDVCQILGKDKVFVSQYRRRAISRKLIIPAGRGYVDYVLPYFGEFINQIQNPDSIFYLGI